MSRFSLQHSWRAQPITQKAGDLLLAAIVILMAGACQNEYQDGLQKSRERSLFYLQHELMDPKVTGSSYTLVRNLPACPAALWHPKAQLGRVLMGRDLARKLKDIYTKPGSTDALLAASELGHIVGTLENARYCGEAAGLQEQVLLGYRDILVEILFSDVIPVDQSFFVNEPKLSWKDRPRAEVEKDLERIMRAASSPSDWQMAFDIIADSACQDQVDLAYSSSRSILHDQLFGSGQCPSCEGMTW